MTDSRESDLLLTHAQGLRRLAHALLRDAQEAEDALQETWAVALERAPDRLAEPGAWLRQVLRSVVHKRLRGSERRRRRESAVARAERTVDTAEVVARGEVLGRVVDAVRALDEPLREVVLLRHFEGLPPREVARRTGLSVAAVNGRLRRAHERLRRELGEDDGTNWLAGLALCFGPDREGPVAIGLAAGSLAMTTTLLMKLSAGAAALTATVLLWPTDAPAVLQAPDVELAEAAPTTSLRESIEPLPRFGGRRSVFDAPSAETAPFLDEGPHEFRLRVHAVDADDLPRHRARLYLAPPESEANLVAVTGEDGWAEVAWIGRRRVMDVDWSLGSGLEGTHPRRLSMAAGRTYEVSASLLRADDADDAGAADARSRKERKRGRKDSRGRRFDPGARCQLDATTAGRDGDGLLRFRSEVASMRIEDHNEASREVDEERFDELRYDWTVSGQVLHDDGRPAADVVVGYGQRLSALTLLRTDAEGWYSFGGMGDASLVLFAGGGVHPHESDRVELHVGVHHAWSPVLDRGIELQGSIRFYDGRPAEGWLVQVESTTRGVPFADTALTGEDGVFRVPDCPPTKLRVRARPADAQCAAPWVEQAGVLATAGHLPFLVLYEEPATIRLPGPRSREVRELRLVHEDTGAISWMRGVQGGWGLDGLPPGTYHLESLAGARGFVTTRSFYVFPEDVVEFDPWLVPFACGLEFEGLTPDEPLDLLLERLDGPVRVDFPLTFLDGPPSFVQVPPGDYRLHSGDREDAPREFGLVEGQRLTLDFSEDTEH